MSKPPVLAQIIGATIIVACAEPNPQLPPPEEILLVANTTGGSLSAVPVNATGSSTIIPLTGMVVSGVGAFGPIAVAPLPNNDAADIVTLRGTQVVRTVGLPTGSGALGVAVINDTLAYVANPNLNSITQINIVTGDTASLAVGQYPQGLIATRGRLFVVNGNVTACGQPGGLCSLGPSWLNVVDPVTNTLADGIDSIPLFGPGNARYAAVGRDGLLYVMNRGIATDSRLSIVDPVGRQELASFGGFGTDPGPLAGDGGERILVSSRSEGLMEFNTRTRTVDRGAGSGVDVPENSGVAVDGSFRTYAIQSGDCAGQLGQSVVLDSTLATIRSFGLGDCAGQALVTLFPSEAQP